MNGDGTVNMVDLGLLRTYLIDPSGVDIILSAADVSGDGNVSAKDVTYLRRYLAGYDAWDKGE